MSLEMEEYMEEQMEKAALARKFGSAQQRQEKPEEAEKPDEATAANDVRTLEPVYCDLTHNK